jgi:hypothetical protein
MRNQQGRKAFIILSDGVDVHSKATIVTAIEYAQRSDTIIYSIFFSQRSFFALLPVDDAADGGLPCTRQAREATAGTGDWRAVLRGLQARPGR